MYKNRIKKCIKWSTIKSMKTNPMSPFKIHSKAIF